MYQSTRGLYIDTRDGVIYNSTISALVRHLGLSEVVRYKLWRAVRGHRPWPIDIPIKPLDREEVADREQRTLYELEVYTTPDAIEYIEQELLDRGLWVRRVLATTYLELQRADLFKCIWHISGPVEQHLLYLHKLARPFFGRLEVIDDEQGHKLFNPPRGDQIVFLGRETAKEPNLS